MEMLACRRFRLRQAIQSAVVLIGSALTLPAHSEIVLLAGATTQSPAYFAGRQGMASIVVMRSPALATDASYLMQRSLAWSSYQRRERNTGLPLVYVPSVTGAVTANSLRQARLRDNLARATAYRLEYYGK